MPPNHDTNTVDLMTPGTVSTGTGMLLVALFLATVAGVPLLQTLDDFQPLPSRVAARATTAWHTAGAEFSGVANALRDTRSTRVRRIAAANARLCTLLKNFEDNLAEQSWLARALRSRTQWIMTHWLEAGNEQAYPGDDGWVFYRPDVDYVTGPGFLHPRHLSSGHGGIGPATAARQHDPLPAIVAFDRILRQHGTTLLIMPVPTKPTLHAAELHAPVPNVGAYQNPSFDFLLRRLQEAGVRVFDCAPILETYRHTTGRPAYLAGDTHWRPEAMQAVAQALATEISALGCLPPSPPVVYRQARMEIASLGDTAIMLGLPPGQDRFTHETVTIAQVQDAGGRPWQRSSDADVLVLGDSFANIFSQPSLGWGASAGLVEQLSFHLQRPVDRIVQNDNGAFATREVLTQRLATRGNEAPPAPRLVIWEFTQRELAFGDWKLSP